jgi:hypothetical protein
MAKKKKLTEQQKLVKSLRRAAREAELDVVRASGRLRSNSWGGKPSNRKKRRKAKLDLHKGDC